MDADTKLSDMDNESLVMVAKDDEQAFNLLFEKNKNFLWFMVKRYLPYQPDRFGYDETELYEAALLGFYKAVKGYKPHAKFTSYLAVVIKNEIAMLYRGKSKWWLTRTMSLETPVHTSGNGQVETLGMTIADHREPFDEKVLSQMVIMQAFTKAKQQLNGLEKTVFAYHVRGENQRQIAERLGLSQPYVSRVRLQVLKKIRECIEKEISRPTAR